MSSSEIGLYKKNRIYYLNRLKQLIKHLDLNDKSVLDLGCGECLLCTLDEFSKIKSYQGVDHMDYSSTPNYIKSDVVEYLKNDINSYDLVLCLGVLDHLQSNQVQNLILQLSLRPESMIILSIRNPYQPIFKLWFPKSHFEDLDRLKNLDQSIYLLKLPFLQKSFKIKFWPKVFCTELILVYKPISFH